MMRSLPIPMYHHVSPSPGLVTCSPETFRAQIRQIAEAGYRCLHADEALSALRGETRLPAKSVLITFDDGYLDNWVYAAPILAEYGMCATIFVVTGQIGDGPPRARAGEASPPPPTPSHKVCQQMIQSGRADEVMMRWSEAEAALASGIFDIHSHTHSHRRWDQEIVDPEIRNERLEADLALSRASLKERLGVDSRHLCWPWGVYDERWRQAALRQGFEALYTTAKGVNTAGSRVDQLHRFAAKEQANQWLSQRLRIYGNSILGSLYSAFG